MRKAFVFDFDDTIAETDCKVKVMEYGSCPENDTQVGELTPSEFNGHQLDDYQYYDYSDFRDADFIHKATPKFLMNLAKEVFGEGHDVYILTARDQSVSDSIFVWLLGHGIAAYEIHCVGGNSNTISHHKKAVLVDMMNKYDKIFFYDDCQANVDIFQHEKLRAYLV